MYMNVSYLLLTLTFYFSQNLLTAVDKTEMESNSILLWANLPNLLRLSLDVFIGTALVRHFFH
jgi:hypothetical protein